MSAHHDDARPTVLIEGYGTVYEDTGELVEPDADAPAAVLQAFGDAEAEFTEAEVEWALRKVFRLDGDILAAETRLRAEVEAIQKNWTPEINRAKRARASFLRWIGPTVRRFAERRLLERNTKADGTPKANPEKTLKYPLGSLAFRTKPATLEKVALKAGVSAAEAAAWVDLHFPACVVQTLAIDYSRFTEADRERLRVMDGCPLEVTEAVPATEEFTIKTGVK